MTEVVCVCSPSTVTTANGSGRPVVSKSASPIHARIREVPLWRRVKTYETHRACTVHRQRSLRVSGQHLSLAPIDYPKRLHCSMAIPVIRSFLVPLLFLRKIQSQPSHFPAMHPLL